LKKVLILILVINFNILNANEIIRDHVLEYYLKDNVFNITNKKINFRLIDDSKSNAFVIDNDYIFLTKGLFNIVNDKEALISIMLHEYGHIQKNHIFKKKNQIKKLNKLNKYTNIFSVLAGVSLGSSDIFFGSSLTLNEVLIQGLLQNTREYEEEADNVMLLYMKKNNINKNSTIEFLNYLEKENSNKAYRNSHPSIKSRINKLKKMNYKMKENGLNDKEFEFLLAKYYKKSNIQIYNNFFSSIEEGKIYSIENDEMSIASKYEIFKKGIEVDNIDWIYEQNISKYNNSFMKLEYLNYMISNDEILSIIKKKDLYKNNSEVRDEFYFHFIMGKVYDYLNKKNKSNFYFCNFYKKISNQKLKNYYCNKYDISKIGTIDLINEINDNIN
jgi:hypothetical protein|tara:strand:+ start:220 stop:1380 length:1161 start_codon:yes stop_codon:yes gene_type:complete